MPAYLLDQNIPSRIKPFHNSDFVSSKSLGLTHSDSLIWEYAKSFNLVIVTKDTDFRLRLLLTGPPPKVVHLCMGNCSVKEFREMIDKLWPKVEALLKLHSLVTVYSDTVFATN